MIARATSFAVTPGGNSPSTLTRRTFGFARARVPVARTWATCDVPMPSAMVPKAPWVLVWLSPHTTVIPGWVRPRSGPTTWTMPWSPESGVSSRTPKSRQFRSMASIISSASASCSGRSWLSVGMMWSTVASVRSG